MSTLESKLRALHDGGACENIRERGECPVVDSGCLDLKALRTAAALALEFMADDREEMAEEVEAVTDHWDGFQSALRCTAIDLRALAKELRDGNA